MKAMMNKPPLTSTETFMTSFQVLYVWGGGAVLPRLYDAATDLFPFLWLQNLKANCKSIARNPLEKVLISEVSKKVSK